MKGMAVLDFLSNLLTRQSSWAFPRRKADMRLFQVLGGRKCV